MRVFFRHIALSFIFLIITFLFFITGKSQNYIFQVYNHSDGLPQVQVIDLLLDSRGYLWTATSGGGIGYFDGVGFSNYSTEKGLGSSMVLCIFEDSKGNLWAGTYEGGLNIYNGQGFKKIRYKDKLNTINAIAEDKNGDLLIASENIGVFVYDGESFKELNTHNTLSNYQVLDIVVDEEIIWLAVHNVGIAKVEEDFTTVYTTKSGLPTDSPFSLFLDSQKRLWIGSDKGLTLFEKGQFKHYDKSHGLLEAPIIDIAEDLDGNLWLASLGEGVAVFDGNKFSHIGKDQGLINNFVRSLAVDPGGNVWIGTNGSGLLRYGGQRFTVLDKNSGLKNNIAIYIYEDEDKNIWFSNVGEGLVKWDRNNFKYYSRNNGLADNIIYGIFQDSKGRMWFGHQTAGVSVYDGNNFKNYTQEDGLAFNFANVIREDSWGNIWISTRKGISRFDGKDFKNFTTQDGLLRDKSYCLAIDDENNVWSAAESGVLNLIKQIADDKTGDINFETHSYTPEQQNLNTFSTITIDNNGHVWIGSFGNGLFVFDGKTFKNYTVTDGISSNQIYSLLFDDKNNLWAGHLKGVDKIKLSGDTINSVKLYSKDQGFIGIETALNSIIQSHTGQVLIGTAGGVMIFNPEHDFEITTEPITNIKGVQIFFENLDLLPYSKKIDSKTFLPEDLVLPYNMNHITFDFIGINFYAPEKVTYSWILEGFEKNWSPPIKNTTATYSKVPPGNYTFRVVSFDPYTNKQSEPAVFTFTIKPPFYKTTAFYIFVSILAFVLVFILVYYRINSLRKLNLKLERLIQERTKELKDEKDNVEKQRNKILAQNIEISRKTAELEETNEELRIKTEDIEKQRSEAEIMNKKLQIEKRKTDELLLNIFPLEIANELKSLGKVSVKEFEMVSVMFTDFCNFVNIAKEFSPIELINILDSNFSAFDNAIEQYRIEKIKTIGDSYMCAGGLPVPNKTNAIEVVLAAIEIQNFLSKQAEKDVLQNKEPFRARIGIHTGDIIAGIIGKKKIAYDIWGETVNLASRMEEAGEACKINISGATYEHIKPYFETEYRGKISMKNTPSIDMYFVNRIKPEFSLDEKGFVPNDMLYQKIGEIDVS